MAMASASSPTGLRAGTLLLIGLLQRNGGITLRHLRLVQLLGGHVSLSGQRGQPVDGA